MGGKRSPGTSIINKFEFDSESYSIHLGSV
jgi:hypothetical protein